MNKYPLFDTNFGILNGREFVKDFNLDNWGVSPDEAAILRAGPEHGKYQSTWKNIVDNKKANVAGHTYSLEESADLTLYIVEE